MAPTADAPWKPRKRPVQARSEVTVAALLEASVQVLVGVGYRKLTTTRVAERAGVSVGTFYQYFPNREALILSVIENYLSDIVSSVERSCRELNGLALDELASGLADAFVASKSKRFDVSRAMHEPLAEVSGANLVKAAAMSAAGFVAGNLRSCRDASFRDERLVALLIVTACSSLMQAAIADPANPVEMGALHAHMRAMIYGYLREARLLEPTSAYGSSRSPAPQVFGIR